MKKLMSVIGAAAVATFTGCKDAEYARVAPNAQNEVKSAAPSEMVVTQDVKPAIKPVKPVKPVTAPSCKCAPGTKHYSPCKCNAPDCMCIVETRSVKPVEPEVTMYTVQGGDFLAKISKRFNVRVDTIKKLNGLKSDKIRVGQKLKLPGKIDISVQAPAPKKAVVTTAKKSSKKTYESYKGATTDYTVKAGDTLGSIAYSNGCNIRQLKELNSLSKDQLRIGQKLKIPAKGKVEEKKAPEAKVAPVVAPEEKNEVAPAVAPAPAETTAPVTTTSVAEVKTETAPAPAPEVPTTTYVVQEGDDMTGVSIRWGISAAAIRELNNLPDDAQLKPGQVIKLPPEAQQ